MKGIGDRDALGGPGPLFLGRDLENAVKVEVHAAEDLVGLFGGRQAVDLKIAHQDVSQCILVLPLIHLDVDLRLIRISGGVSLGARQRQRRVARNDRPVAVRIGHTAARSEIGNPERVGRDVDQDAFDRVAGKP